MAASTPRNTTNKRLYLLGAMLLFWCLAICLRLVYLQIFRYGDYVTRAQHQQNRTMEIAAKRGIIYDRAGRELAMSISVDSIFAIPNEIPDLPGTIALLARITNADPRELLARCRPNLTFCWIARKTDADIADRIRSLHLKGINFQKETKRYYPKRELAAQVLGYVGMDDSGLSGIEREFNDELRGEDGSAIISVDARRKWFQSVEKQPVPGRNVVLTIDEKIQYIAERELERAMAETHAETGTVVVENPHTGEILALANRPTFNPNVAREITPERLKDHAVSDAYEPGSTFKLVTISAALEEKLTRPDEVFDCQMGSIVIAGMRIRDSRPHGLLPVSGILAESSDVGAIKIALRLGEDRFYKYIQAYGFGQPTGVELPAEAKGLTKPVSRWSKVSIGAISMGQEIGITPLQLASMVSTMANDGVQQAPHIVAATVEAQRMPQTVVFNPTGERRVISPLTAAQMRQMMQGVVLEGTGRRAILEGYTSAGKTGTAQKIDPATGGYSHTKYVASFAGFAPLNNPAITIAVILDSPVGLHQGGQVSAPVFQRIAQQTLEYLHVAHDVDLPQSRRVLLARQKIKEDDLAESSPDHLGEPLDLADAKSTSIPVSSKPSAQTAADVIIPAAMRSPEPLAPAPSGATKIMASNAPNSKSPAAEAPSPDSRPSNGTVVIDVEQGGIEVPSFLGKTLRSALETAQNASLELDPIGSGMAREQMPVPGSHVAAGARITVRFSR